jgi:hypothetical protein
MGNGNATGRLGDLLRRFLHSVCSRPILEQDGDQRQCVLISLRPSRQIPWRCLKSDRYILVIFNIHIRVCLNHSTRSKFFNWYSIFTQSRLSKIEYSGVTWRRVTICWNERDRARRLRCCVFFRLNLTAPPPDLLLYRHQYSVLTIWKHRS